MRSRSLDREKGHAHRSKKLSVSVIASHVTGQVLRKEQVEGRAVACGPTVDQEQDRI